MIQAKRVCAVMDGADWLQSLVDLHRPDALRILDFPHAVQRLSAIVEARQQAGKALLAAWAVIQRHQLKEEGPAAVLQDIEQVQTAAPEVEEVQEHLRYLRKREALMQYPSYQQQGWPIGSGMVESGNKVVMQARLKGAGMRWAPHHVNPMLALRTAVCNDRWSEAYDQLSQHRRFIKEGQRIARQRQRQEHASQQFLLAWVLLFEMVDNSRSLCIPPLGWYFRQRAV